MHGAVTYAPHVVPVEVAELVVVISKESHISDEKKALCSCIFTH